MKLPPVQYATTSDGKRIAYAVCGQGETLVFVPALFGHVNLGWEIYPSWFHGLADNYRFDWLHDLEAVMEAAAPGRTVLMAGCHGGHVAVRYAIKHPERIRALVLNTCSLRQDEWTPSMWQEVPRENWRFFLRSVSPPGLSAEETEHCMKGLDQSLTPDDLRVAVRAIFISTIEDEVGLLNVPTLVLATPEHRMLLPESSARLASRISGASLVSIDGEYIYGDGEQGVAAIEDFLEALPANERASPPGDDGLSQREIEVLRLLAKGMSNQDIADDLVISVNTVRRHVSNIFAKIGASNRAQATAYAKDQGIA
jgi:DNA-binding CsgD family transcriptional regulator/pimeloyl-ACP methyl ester carboxylesterase